MMLTRIFYRIYLCIRPSLKWFLHKFTNLCELQRICYGIEAGTKRVKKVERSLELSRCVQIKQLLIAMNSIIESAIDEVTFKKEVINRSVETILLVKKINRHVHTPFVKAISGTMEVMWSYRALYFLVEDLRTTQFDDTSEDHERKLLELWDLLMKEEKLEGRITKQWQTIGFQGDDPKTDFRGMGLLGLLNLLYFAQHYGGTARHLLSHSLHPQHGYTFAIVGINITSMAWRLLKTGTAKSHFYNVNDRLKLNHFHEFYCYLFVEFDQEWCKAKPKSIMDFPTIQAVFEANVLSALRSDKCIFKMNLRVENI